MTSEVEKVKRDFELLAECIEHWENVKKGPDWNALSQLPGNSRIGLRSMLAWKDTKDLPTCDNCRLCVVYHEDSCVGCPIAKYGGGQMCLSTPYYKVTNALFALDISSFATECSDMIKLLKDIKAKVAEELVSLEKEEPEKAELGYRLATKDELKGLVPRGAKLLWNKCNGEWIPSGRVGEAFLTGSIYEIPDMPYPPDETLRTGYNGVPQRVVGYMMVKKGHRLVGYKNTIYPAGFDFVPLRGDSGYRWVVEDDPNRPSKPPWPGTTADVRPLLSGIEVIPNKDLSREEKHRLLDACLDGKALLYRFTYVPNRWYEKASDVLNLNSKDIQYVVRDEYREDVEIKTS